MWTRATSRFGFTLASLLMLPLPAVADPAPEPVVDSALVCVHRAMTRGPWPSGVFPEQIAEAAVARCYDEIESAAAAAVRSKDCGLRRADEVRLELRRQFYEYALQIGVGATRVAAMDASETQHSPESAAPQSR